MLNVLLEEYRTLREELLLHIRQERQIVVVSGTVYFAMLAFLAKFGQTLSVDLWGIAPIVFLTPLFLLYRAELFSIAKIASYIGRFIEPEAKGLRWTRANIESSSKFGNKLFGWFPFRVSPHQAIGLYFIVLLFISWVVPPYLKGQWPSWLALSIMAGLSLVYIANFVSLIRYRSHRLKWEKIWEKTYTDMKAKG